MKFFKTDFPECSNLNDLYFVDFLYLLDPTIGHHIEDMMQKVNDKQFLRVLDFHYGLISLKLRSHGLALLEHQTIVCSTVDVRPGGILLRLQELVFYHPVLIYYHNQFLLLFDKRLLIQFFNI